MANLSKNGLMVVFDVDDTLYLERSYVASGFEALEPIIQNRFNKTGFREAAWRHFTRGVRGNIFNLALVDIGLRPSGEIIGNLVDQYRNHRPEISLELDALEILEELLSAGVGIGVLTDGPASSQQNKISALGLGRVSEIAIVTDLYGPGYGKPHLRGFQEIEMRTKYHRYVYVADNPMKDFAAPKKLGWDTVRIIREHGLHASVESADDVDIEVNSLRRLTSVYPKR